MSSLAIPVLSKPAGYTSVEGAATHTSLSSKRVRQLIANGRLASYRVDGRILISFEDIDRMVRGQAASDPHSAAVHEAVAEEEHPPPRPSRRSHPRA